MNRTVHMRNVMRVYSAEFFGTFWLVLGGCGSAVLAAAFPDVGIGLLGVSFAFGLTVLTMAYAIGHISGCHLNPAVSVGLCAGGDFLRELLPYIVAQVLGAIVAGGVLYLIATGKAGFDVAAGFASNGYDEHSPGGYSCWQPGQRGGDDVHVPDHHSRGDRQARPARVRTDRHRSRPDLDSPDQHPGHQYSVNPARSTGVAVFVGGWAVAQLWLFWVAPMWVRCWVPSSIASLPAKSAPRRRVRV